MLRAHPEQADDLTGRVVFVTGATSGVGLEASRILAGAGAHVVLGCREIAKGKDAAADIAESHPGADTELLECDLADLGSIARAARAFADAHERLDVLVNNAGVMATPYRRTADGFELQFGVNHLGHFALTGRLLPPLLAAPAGRVVTVASSAHRIGTIDFDNLDGSRSYNPWRAYGTSKLANLLFTFELQRRATAAGAPLEALAAHPGYAATNLQAHAEHMRGSSMRRRAMRAANAVLAQPPRKGAWPLTAAATAPGVAGGDYLGPRGPFELRGRPTRVSPSRVARDPALARRLWQVSETLTGVRDTALGPPG